MNYNELFKKIKNQFQDDLALFHPFKVNNSYEQVVKDLIILAKELPEINLQKTKLEANFMEENGPLLDYIDSSGTKILSIYPARVPMNQEWVWGYRMFLFDRTFFHYDLKAIIVNFSYKMADLLKDETDDANHSSSG